MSRGVISGTDTVLITSTAIDIGTTKKLSQFLIRQSPKWNNWQSVRKVFNRKDAPILLPVTEGHYWLFNGGPAYAAYFSTDMKTWQSRGRIPVSWATTAEWINEKIYLYYDKPNDGDPHLIIGTINGDSISWEDQGMVFDDPTYGSDCAVIRAADNQVHLIFEDWSPIDPSQASWDSRWPATLSALMVTAPSATVHYHRRWTNARSQQASKVPTPIPT